MVSVPLFNLWLFILQDRHPKHYQYPSSYLPQVQMLAQPEVSNDTSSHELQHTHDTNACSIQAAQRTEHKRERKRHANDADQDDEEEEFRCPGTCRNSPGRLHNQPEHTGYKCPIRSRCERGQVTS